MISKEKKPIHSRHTFEQQGTIPEKASLMVVGYTESHQRQNTSHGYWLDGESKNETSFLF